MIRRMNSSWSDVQRKSWNRADAVFVCGGGGGGGEWWAVRVALGGGEAVVLFGRAACWGCSDSIQQHVASRRG